MLRAEGQSVDNNATPRTVISQASGVRRAAQNTDAIRFRCTDGANFDVIYAVYGVL
jgi:hypothetical protein